MSSFLERTYHLKASPFKQKSAFFDLLPTWANREEQIKQWNKILDDSVKTTSANYIVLIIGDYGMGKSLSLIKIYQEAKDRKIHYPVLTTFLSEQRIKNPGLDFIFRIFRQIDFKDFNIKKESLDVLNELDPEVKIIFNHILFGNEDIKKIALAYFRGEISPTQKQLKDLEVIRKITDLDLLLLYLIGLLYIIKKSGFSNFTIIIDEFEYVFSLVSRSSQPIYLALLRRLYDLKMLIPKQFQNITSNITLFLAVSPDGERHLVEIEKTESETGGPTAALRRRISDNKILLTAFTEKATRELIEKRLKISRITGKIEKEPLIPFNEEFVKFIHEITDGRPEMIIDRCNNVLDVGLEQRIPLLTKQFAIEVFKERGIQIEP